MQLAWQIPNRYIFFQKNDYIKNIDNSKYRYCQVFVLFCADNMAEELWGWWWGWADRDNLVTTLGRETSDSCPASRLGAYSPSYGLTHPLLCDCKHLDQF